ncbi:MAG: type I glyceraldehyde-3-phosphate dehydrogenase [Cyanobacteria bacterium]|nr:type I glyceraldehyde-3-phosphate dehydrogenase [Cyanobacteriota bacterium]MDA1019953.1 type I glyceraldehyde-3-phosphate dehydrogenase [Cyanobacteriota bacterium]
MSKVKVGINGFGRIGRNVFRTLNQNFANSIEVVAINDPVSDPKISAHLIKYDSILGRYKGTVSSTDNDITIDGKTTKFLKERNPADIGWDKLGVDVVLECSGVFTDGTKAQAHIDAGAKKVLISAPATNEDITIVMGVNDDQYNPAIHNIISNASCTTNCLAPVTKVLDDKFGIESGLMTTIHAYTSDQRLLDNAHSDPRRSRAAAQSMIPTTTGAAKAISLVLPHLAGKLNGFAIRVPTPNVSVTDVVFTFKNDVTKETINAALKEAAEGELKGILDYTEEPLVSIDFTSDPHSSIIDAAMTTVVGTKQAKILSWYDNEYGYSNRLCELAIKVGNLLPVAA